MAKESPDAVVAEAPALTMVPEDLAVKKPGVPSGAPADLGSDLEAAGGSLQQEVAPAQEKGKEHTLPPAEASIEAPVHKKKKTGTCATEWKALTQTEDWLAVHLGLIQAAVAWLAVGIDERVQAPLPRSRWCGDLVGPFSAPRSASLIVMMVIMLPLAAFARLRAHAKAHEGEPVWKSGLGYMAKLLCVAAVAVAALVLGSQQDMRSVGIGYAVWALVFGLFIGNVLDVAAVRKWAGAEAAQKWLAPAVGGGEFFIKVGLVLLAVDIGVVVNQGARGLLVAFVVPPLVLVFGWILGQCWIPDRLAMIITMSAAVSICGASAATAAAAAVMAPKQDLALAIGLISVGGVFWMMIQPYVAIWLDLPDAVAGAWLGGTIDLTGAVVAAGQIVSFDAEATATIVKLTQNSFLGVFILGVATAWLRFGPSEAEPATHKATPKATEVASQLWQRFPKFVIGYLIVSIVMSFAVGARDETIAVVRGAARVWFALGFVGIGATTSLKLLTKAASQPSILGIYLLTQLLDIFLTLGAAYIAFGI